jgi:hypothetical protein
VLEGKFLSKMAESLQEQIEALEEKIAKLTAGASVERHAVKDISVASLIPEFTGRPGDLKVHEFLEAVNSVGGMGAWTEEDKKYAAKLKLGGTAKRFCLSNAELHDKSIIWSRFSAVLETRFRFVETDQYHYQRLL